MKAPSLWRLALVNLLFYAIDMGCAVAGFVIGFGLEVKSWAAVIGFMVLSRWLWHVIRGVIDMRRDKEPRS